MGLFTKKDPCAICGGKVKALLPWKVDDQLVCNACYDRVDLPRDRVNEMKIDEFRGYMAFREENAQLKPQFHTTQTVDMGAFQDSIVFDTDNRLFCMRDDLKYTIFEGKDVKSFTIREDDVPLFEGSPAGLKCYTSTVPDRLNAMTPMLHQAAMIRRMERLEEEKARAAGEFFSVGCNDIQEPFGSFVVEIHCEHPYWPTIKAERQGPTFNDDRPSPQDYLNEYKEGSAIMGQLARALMAVAFPGAPEEVVAARTAPAGAGAAASADVVAEIQRFKELMDLGILTEEEFEAKKRQMLGI